MDPAVAAANRLASAQKVLQTAFEQGIISAQKKAAMLRQLNAQYKADELNRYAAAQRKVSDTIIQGDAVVKRLSGDMQLLTERLKQGTVTQQQHDTALKALARQLAINNNYVKANGQLNVQKAMAELRAMEATRAAAAADAAAAATKARLTQSYNQLLASINPVIARQQQTRQTVDMLRAAVAAGAITTTQAAQALNQYRNALRAMDAANQLATRGMNRVGVITQQAGYQVGDFIVQIQSGTNVMVALGQQATQLIGTFAMLARTTRGIAIFSALGVAVPILTAVGAAIMRASGASDTLEQKLQKLDQSADKLGTTLDRLEDTDLAEKFGDLTDEVISISNAMVLLDESAQLKNLIGVLDRVEDAASANVFRKFFEGMASGLTFGMVGAGAAQSDEQAFQALGFDMARSQFLSYTEELQRLAQSGDTAGVVAEFNRFIQDATDNGAELSMSGIALAASMEKAALATAETAARLNGSAQAAADLAAANAERAKLDQAMNEETARQQAALLEENARFEQEQIDKRVAAEAAANERRVAAIELYYDNAEKREAELARVEAERQRIRQGESDFIRTAEAETELARRKLEILQSYNAEGEATARTQELQIALDMDILRGKLLQQAAVDGLTQAERDAIDAQVQLAAEVARTEAGLANAANQGNNLANALRDANAAMQGLAGFSANLDKALAVSVAKVDALRRGANAAVAGSIEGMRVDLSRREQELVAAGVDRSLVSAMTQGDRDKLAQLSSSEQERVRLQESRRGGTSGTSGTSGAAAAQDDYLQNLLLEAEQKRKLVGLSEEETRRQEILFELEKRDLSLKDDRIEQIIQTEAETRKLMQAEQERQQLMDTVEGHIKSAFMSMVDGSASVEDAFRNMLRNIILAIYEQQVAEPAARGIGNFLSSIISGIGGGAPTTSAPTTSIRPVARPLAADGRAYNNGVEFFANGGIVSSPTLFGHSTGVGMMGEAGPEAIMPLKRGANGKLGVQVDGNAGNVTVDQYFSIAANGDDSVRRIVRQEAPRIAEQAKAAVVDAKRRGGTYGRSF
jgi:phage-related minor tail protein